ncbi:MAG TPA: hypothetical protein VKT78_20385 [Fimbriimonadaceae bacterium]|nr:hypothetical protein [Fimbriimonadaceae bacterium]
MPQNPYVTELEIEGPTLAPEGSEQTGTPGAGEPTGASERRTVEGIVLENGFLACTFVPALGGRLISLIDKGSGQELLSGHGLEITLDGHRRTNAFGPVRAAVGESSIRMSEIGAPGGIGIDIVVSLADEAVLDIEIGFRNRTLAPVAWNPGWIWAETGWQALWEQPGAVLYRPEADAGIALLAEGPADWIVKGQSALRFEEPRILPPRWGVRIATRIVPFGGIGEPVHVTTVAALGIGESGLALQPRTGMPGSKLLLQTPGGQTLEAPADLDPATNLTYTFEELNGRPAAFAILNADRRECFLYPPPVGKAEHLPAQPEHPDPSDLTNLAAEPAYRYWVANLRTRDAFQAADFEEAHAQAEIALLFNGDDPLAWIEQAVAARHLEAEETDAPALPNAHYLAPLEPLLRAESLLAQSGLDAKAFLAPLAEIPAELVEVACFYLERGLLEDSARFLDAALTVSDAPMLHLLHANVCLQNAATKADAASAVRLAAKIQPPMPWRPIEMEALTELRRSFPGNLIVEGFSAIVGL